MPQDIVNMNIVHINIIHRNRKNTKYQSGTHHRLDRYHALLRTKIISSRFLTFGEI